MVTGAEAPTKATSLVEKWGELARLDDARRDVEMILREEFRRAERSEKSLQIEIERMKAYEKELFEQRSHLELTCKALQERVDTAPFVMVLVDGDNTQFLDVFVRAGFDGGHQAAQLLRQHLEEYFREFCGYESHWKIMVHIYANLHGMVDTYHRAGVVSDLAIARKFLTGFNRELPFFEFIDAGNDREAADKKIKDYLTQYHGTANCKHVVLAGSGDRGYVGYLRQFSSGTSDISLIEAVPFEPSFRSLARHFRTKTFPEVFKATKLETQLPELRPQVTRDTYAAATSVVGMSSPEAGQSIPITLRPALRSREAENFRHILRYNECGHRLDERLPYADKETVQRLKALVERPCARYYLTNCAFGELCKFSHNAQYNEGEKRALKRLARFNPCGKGKHCDDVDCVASHCCVYDGHCEYEDCRFGPEMHGIDKAVAGVRRV